MDGRTGEGSGTHRSENRAWTYQVRECLFLVTLQNLNDHTSLACSSEIDLASSLSFRAD